MIVGHLKQLQFLTHSHNSGNVGHAYLLSGPDKIGKKTLALEWVSQILGTPVREGSANSDFLFVAPLADPKTGEVAKEITVDQIRNLIWKLSLKPLNSPLKAAIIDNAHLMNAEAQNCLLKTLEEPPGSSLIILAAESSQRLLPTIRSRCEILQFSFVSQEDLKACAAQKNAQLDSAQIAEIVSLSFGRPGRLIEFLNDPALVKKWYDREKEFARAVSSTLPDRFAYVKQISENPDLAALLEIWQFHFRNKMLQALSGKPQSAQTPDAPKQFLFTKSKTAGNSPERSAAILKKIHELNVLLQTTNASPKLALENFMLDL